MAAAFYQNRGLEGALNPVDFLRCLTSTYQDPNVANSPSNTSTRWCEETRNHSPRSPEVLERSSRRRRRRMIRRSSHQLPLEGHEQGDEELPHLDAPSTERLPGVCLELHELGTDIDAQRTSQRRAVKKLRNLSSTGSTFPPRSRHRENQTTTSARDKTPPPRTPSSNAMDSEPT
jgi:hypothetical protein